MTVNHINLTRLASCALLATFLMAGITTTPALAQEYKEAFNAARTAAEAKDYTTAYTKYEEAARGAQSAGDQDVLSMSNRVLSQLDRINGNKALKAKNYDVAKGHFEKGIARNANNAKSHYGLGLALKNLGDIDGAMASFMTAMEVGSASGDRKTSNTARGAIRKHFYYQASSAVSKQNPSAADGDRTLAALEALKEYLEPDADFWYYTAEAYKAKSNFAQSLSAADNALELHKGTRSDKAKIYFVKGEALMATGNFDGAKAAFTNAAYGSYKAAAEDMINNRLN